ncbi:hypothetical protein RDI58_008437 [Solanum bulbocastanum]|uniref:RNase H type-1 domain-containing protein n=1 Tax=Solanum bulbocastanum TaxID=147425 RepID=A0AAN8TX68_SOLBU
MLNTDGAVKNNPGDGGLGGVVRNHKGDWVVGFVSKEANTTPILAELNALRQGLTMAISNNLVPLETNIDSQEVVNMFHEDNALYNNLIYECRLLMERLGAAPQTHVFREQNRVTDMLSKEGLKCETFGTPTFLIVPPMYANSAVWNILGTMYVREANLCNYAVTGHILAQGNTLPNACNGPSVC